MTGRLVAIVLLAVLATAAAAAAQQAPARDARPPQTADAGTASISGIVTAAADGTALRGVGIQLTGAGVGREPRGAFTDAEGRYEFAGLPPGQYTLVASKVGFMKLTYGQIRTEDTGRPVEVTANARVEHIDFALPRGAVIVVRVLDALGDPVPSLRVAVSQPRFSGGERKLVQVVGDPLIMTDDRGEVRLSGLGPGDYYVSTAPGPAISAASIPLSQRDYQVATFYPGVGAEAEAQPVGVALGDEVFVAMQLAGGHTAKISGEFAASGHPTLRLERRGIGGSTLSDVSVGADGKSFSAAGLAPGDYVLTVRTEKEFGTLRVQLAGEDLAGLVIPMQPTLTLRGRFTFDGGSSRGLIPSSLVLRPLLDQIRLQPVAQVKNDFTFELPEANGTGVLRLEQAPRGWFLKAVLAGGRDITDSELDMNTLAGQPLEVVVTQRTTEVSGHVVDARGRPAASAVVVVFPEDRRLWTARSRGIIAARLDQSGLYTARGVPDGRYLVAAVNYLAPGDERDPGALQRLALRAMPIALVAGEPVTLDLQLAP